MEIVWTDACINTDHEGNLNDEAAGKFGGLIQCRDIGYLISKTRTDITLAVSLCPEDGSYRHSNTIPRGWVQEIIPLSRPQLEATNEESEEAPPQAR